MAPPPPEPAPAPSSLDPRALQHSFAQFLERPENRELARAAHAEEARAAALLAEREADARLRAAVRGLRERERRGVERALLRAGPASSSSAALLRGVLLSLCNPEAGDHSPKSDSARLQTWLENPRVMEMVRRAAAAAAAEGRGGGGNGNPPPLDRLFSAAAAAEGCASPKTTSVPTHALADALNEHARRMALGRAALASSKGEKDEEALTHFSAASAAVAGLRPEDDDHKGGSLATLELTLAHATACAAQADVHLSRDEWAAARAACDAGVAALGGGGGRTPRDNDALVALLCRRGRALLENRDLPAAKADLEQAREVLARVAVGPGAREAWERGALRPLAEALGAAEGGAGGDGDEKQRQRALFARMLKGI